MLKNICSYLSRKVQCKNTSELILLSSFRTNDNKISLNFPKEILPSNNEVLEEIKRENHFITDSKITEREVAFVIDKQQYLNDVFSTVNTTKELLPEKETIVVEYSSPNIAKPFHLGNLRSTIIGNFISNINSHFNNQTIRINYLGDWGTQFGYLNVGLNKLNLTDSEIKEDPINVLYKAYVLAHNLEKSDAKVSKEARQIFANLEKGDSTQKEKWSTIRKYAIDELESTYSRIGVKFDHYDWESMYGSVELESVVNLLNSFDLLKTDTEGRKVIEVNSRKITFLKSDSSSLYISRDIAAALDRYRRFNFDKMFYVVDTAQTDHFESLKYILHELKCKWADNIQHVKFGRVHGLSTRRGNTVFLKDILNEVRNLMRERQIKSTTTKVSIENEAVTDILGTSCVIINDLKQKREKSYNFDWNRILQTSGDSGAKLQYTHCRLNSLLNKNCGIDLPIEADHHILLSNTESKNLLIHLSNYNSVLYRAYREMEACVLVTYLFQLCNLTSNALKVLRVKNEADKVVAGQRLLLFSTCKSVLKEGMQILGLQPLNEM